MKKIVTKLLLGLLVAGLLFTAWGGAVWAKGTDSRGLLRGTVTVIEGATLVIATPQGEQSVLTNEKTVFLVPGVEAATLADVTLGDYVVVRARPAEDGTLLATAVMVVPAGQQGDVVLRGLVTAVEGTTLTVRTRRQRDIAVLTDEQTLFHVPGLEDPTVADVQVGRIVLALGRLEGDESFRAAGVFVVSGAVVRRHVVHGKVTAVDGQALTVNTPRGKQRVLTDENTRLRMPGVENPVRSAERSRRSLADVVPGVWIIAVGRRNEDGSLQARGILAISERLQRHALRGQVAAIEGNVLTIETQRGQVQVVTDEHTRYRALFGAEQPSLTDGSTGPTGVIAVGNHVVVFARRAEDGDALAVAIIVLPRRLSRVQQTN
jgi:RNase P/RNase MRP subunit p29